MADDSNYSKGTQGINGEIVQGEISAQLLPDGYLKNGYYKEEHGEKVLRPEYIVIYPNKIKESLIAEGAKGEKNRRSQIRKFYDYTLRVNNLLNRKSGNFDLVEAELKRMIPFVEDAKSRDKVTDTFESFIVLNVNSIHDADDLKAFVKHFEALVAYMPKDKN